MRVRLTSAAEVELVDAHEWYKAQSPSAARRSLIEFETLKQRLTDNPSS